MARIGLWLVLLLIAGYVAFKLCYGLLEILSGMRAWEVDRFGGKEKRQRRRERERNTEKQDCRLIEDKPQQPVLHGIHGKCEICEKEFSPVASPSANCLNRVTLEFYCRPRDRLICAKCGELLTRDANCKIIKIHH